METHPIINQETMIQLVNDLYLAVQNEILEGTDDGFYGGILKKGSPMKSYNFSVHHEDSGNLLNGFIEDQIDSRPDCVILATQYISKRSNGKYLERLIAVGQMRTGFKYVRESVITRIQKNDEHIYFEEVRFTPSICGFSHVSDLDSYIRIRN